MTRAEKQATIESLQAQFKSASNFYITDSSTLTVGEINQFRGMCFEKDIKYRVAKNTLIQKALEAIEGQDYSDVLPLLKGPTAIMFSEVSNMPAKIIKEFRKKHEKPILKGAYIDNVVFVGDDQVKALAELKSKEELVGEIIGLLQSPAKNVISALQSAGNKLSGIVKTLSERSE
jgi:large subunit ribosomal protein L10